jgi:isopropylmalate/homocitrate/citramalate synthase
MTAFRNGRHPVAAHPSNLLTDALAPPLAQEQIVISDNTLRDGEQAAHVAFSLDEKLELARALDDVGVHMISAGFPAVSSDEERMVREIAALGLRASIRVFSRLRERDLEVARESGADVVSTFVPLSDIHIEQKLKTTESELLDRIARLLPPLVASGGTVRLAFEDCTRAPLTRLLRFVEAAEAAGVSIISLPDTCGVMTPSAMARLIGIVRPLTRTQIIVHCHNDLGLATANSLAALEAGADGVDATAGGIGERTGNARLEEIAVILRVKYGRDVGIRLDRLRALVQLVARCAGRPVPCDEPIVGDYAFAHEAGIHVAGVLADPRSYEPFPPAIVGAQHQFIFGKHSGMQGLRHLLETHGVVCDDSQANALLARVKEAGQAKRRVTEAMILEWARELQPVAERAAERR